MKRISVAVLGALVLGPVSQGAIVNLRFTGQANFVGANIAPGMQVGDAFTFDVSYDTDAPNISFNPATEGSYASISANAIIQTTGDGPFAITWDNPGIQIENPGSYQRISFGTVSSSPPSFDETFEGKSLTNAVVSLFTDSTTPIDGVSLPTSLNISDFSTNPSSTGMYLYFNPGASADFVRFSISDITVVPEPSTYAFFTGALILGLCALTHQRRRKN